ncbi:nucleoside triphosphate pyrophosphohydrolase/pyrophosphatase MazG [Geobacter sp. OR-1]|uniref:nucleoside triphosphate pyrophosphohydrolase n=1 Tax=Geobacter sp. OR-1 TaxID=1266765 RepID=UPI0005421CBC|nr:nucleoside triphosphate pyrophosphohydrolase [Geobacter sp. OR-1]GAM10939.1 nucleoside triphosphate pyrophosphohydrolase/pyrophosphatase MazG [Geobacter sp. OR-1]
MPSHNFEQLVLLMRKLRAPGGCPWDAEQTHDSLKRYLIEECYEVIEAIDSGNDSHLVEELGDLLLQPIFHATIAEERNAFDISDIINSLCEKLIRRHPHVFSDQQISTSEEQIENWEKIKRHEKGEQRKSALSGVPPHLPAILKAHKITEKASRVGFDWETHDQVLDKIREELAELEETMAAGNTRRIEEELGDLLFAVVNLGRFLSIDPEDALRKTIHRFIVRFNFIEESLLKRGSTPRQSNLQEMELLWQEAKKSEKESAV